MSPSSLRVMNLFTIDPRRFLAASILPNVKPPVHAANDAEFGSGVVRARLITRNGDGYVVVMDGRLARRAYPPRISLLASRSCGDRSSKGDDEDSP